MDQEACLDLDDDAMDLDDVDPTGPAMSAAAYFRQVKAERRQTADVVRIQNSQQNAPESTKKKQQQWLESVGFQKEDGAKNETSSLVPSVEWRAEKCRQFGDFREILAEKIAKTQPMKIKLAAPSDDEWHEILLEKCLPEFQETCGNFKNHTGTPPSVLMVLAIPKRHLSQLIENLVEWSSEEGLSRPIREWIYALLLVIDLPLVQDVIAALRTLAKDCRKLRSRLPADRKAEANEYSMFIAIIGTFFGQKDLADI